MKSEIQSYRNKLLRKLSKLGVSPSLLSEASELSQGRISQILSTDEATFSEASYRGAPCKLDSSQKKKLKLYLDQGAESHDFEGKIWTADRVRLLIQEKFGISYHKHHIPRLLEGLGYSLQVPKKVDYRRDPDKVEDWKLVKIKEIKKKAELENRKIYYVDEASLQLLASIQKSYSKIGVRPIVETKHKYRVYSIAGAVAEDGDLFYNIRTGSYNGDTIVNFIESLLEHAQSKILIIWDGATCHINDEVKAFLENLEDQEVWLEKIPPYCPELNASEQVWNYLKNVELKNVCCKTAKELKIKAIEKLELIKEKTELIKSFFRHPDVAFY